MKLLSFLCKYKGHSYKFKRAWEAEKFIIKTGQEFILAKNDYEYKNELEVKYLIESKNLNLAHNKHYLINLECKRCGHRISIDDVLYSTEDQV